jgi:hypothetical protein
MILLNELNFENNKHISTRVIKTFSDRKIAEKYLENCLLLNSYIHSKQKYELQEI